jgi:hypothetical protein
MASAYILELSVHPGGSRWAETHTWTQPWQLRLLLEEFCANTDNLAAYHCISYGATLAIWVVQAGHLVDFVDLHPFIVVTLPDGNRSLAEFLADHRALNAFLDAHEDGWLEDIELTLFWEPIAERLPQLMPPVLLLDESVNFEGVPPPTAPKDSYLSFANPLTLGSKDHEGGGELEPPFELPH